MRVNVLILALASLGLSGPSNAGTKTVFRPPVTTRGKVPAAELQALELRVDQEFARAEFEPSPPSDPLACTAAPCWREQADARGSHYIASVSLDAVAPDQRLAITVVDLTDGSVVAELESTCELCGRDELRDALADLCAAAVRRLQSHDEVITELTIDSVPPGAAVVVDGREVGATPVRIEVPSGAHTVQLSADGYEPFSQPVQIERGTRESIRPHLTATAAPAVVVPPSPAGPFRRRPRVVAGAALLGGGLSAAAAGVALMVLHGNPITSDCDGSLVDADGDCRYLHDTRTGGVVGLSLGVAAVVGGTALLSIELPRERPGTIALSPTPTGVRVRGRF